MKHLLIVSEAHFRRVLMEYVRYFQHARPQHGINQRVPEPEEAAGPSLGAVGKVIAFPVLGGLQHEYRRAA